MIVFLLYLYGWREAILISVIRILVIGFLFGNLFSILFSLAGASLSLLVMGLLKRAPGFTVIGVVSPEVWRIIPRRSRWRYVWSVRLN